MAQKNWLAEELIDTTAFNWKIVIGHHPIFTTSMRKGLLQDVKQSLLPFFENYKVDAYIAGHEHDLQHQKQDGFPIIL